MGRKDRLPRSRQSGHHGRLHRLARRSRDFYSSYIPALDLFAPGRDIASAWNTSATATKTISGTTTSTPHVADAIACYLQNDEAATPAQVSTDLVTASTKNKVTYAGAGSPNHLLFVGTGN
ncbi:S8 family serine peptidase [Lentzea sp. HUAS12]|uniref:S8 family serine peptidase n=1 Tax=Lentzea sp. HUAS12 TaxID=2951806 RepID=UPI0020A0F7EA|nr:S8 family serine peptidase [Lentzea sp. HUAS12]USX56318.1 S8 family serine peptidase [Lentzea sp. HUAS12]